MFCIRPKRTESAWIVFNLGTDLEFAECENCGNEINAYDEYDMPRCCRKCGAHMTDVKFEDEV